VSPGRKKGGHEQGLKRTIVVAVEPHVRADLEAEADSQSAEQGANITMSDIVRAALDAFLYED
jgi:hypothetical protein